MTFRIGSTLLAGLALGTLVHAQPARAQGAASQTVNRWIQLGPNGTVLARAITTGTTCPALAVDGAPVTMTARSQPTATFPVLQCEASLPLGGTAAVIDGQTLKLPVANPRRIVVVGDTGCRIKGTAIQACNDPNAFPLARLSGYVASFQPDLIVHVGDYYYRESACPAASAGNGTTTGCGGSPFGDTWASWNADWFTPAQAMMSAAPMALTRGNHESCARGQNGWFTLLDAHAYSAAAVGCTAGSASDFTAPYVVGAGAVQLLMFDSSFANDSAITPNDVAIYQSQLQAALPQLTRPTLFVTHKPSYGLISSTGAGASTTVTGGDADEQALFSTGVPAPIGMLLSGHIHNYQAVQFASKAYAPQLVVGNSGTLLDPDYVPTNSAGGTFTTAAGTSAAITATSDQSEFGFAVLDAVPGGFLANLYDLNGTPHGRCVIQPARRSLACTE